MTVPMITELSKDDPRPARVIATRVARVGTLETWDLELLDDSGEVVAAQEFSFDGDFGGAGLDFLAVAIRAVRLVYGPAEVWEPDRWEAPVWHPHPKFGENF